MAKRNSVVAFAGVPSNCILDKDNAARIPNIASHKQFKRFADAVASLLCGAKMEQYRGKDASSTFPFEDLIIYPLAFRVGFGLPLHPIVAELLKRLNISPHRVVTNTWRAHATTRSLHAQLDIQLGLNELLSVYCCKILNNENFALALRPEKLCFVKEAPRQSGKKCANTLLKISS